MLMLERSGYQLWNTTLCKRPTSKKLNKPGINCLDTLWQNVTQGALPVSYCTTETIVAAAHHKLNLMFLRPHKSAEMSGADQCN